jgi:hypothetical protein
MRKAQRMSEDSSNSSPVWNGNNESAPFCLVELSGNAMPGSGGVSPCGCIAVGLQPGWFAG